MCRPIDESPLLVRRGLQRVDIDQGDCPSARKLGRLTVPLLRDPKLNQGRIASQRLGLATNCVGARLRRHLDLVGLCVRCERTLRGSRFRLSHTPELFVLGLECFLLGLDFFFDSAIELGRKIEIGNRDVRQV
jgi:hypothetical protein